jgi:hypothetical protein
MADANRLRGVNDVSSVPRRSVGEHVQGTSEAAHELLHHSCKRSFF